MKTYSYNEALEASTLYFGGDDLAAKVFLDKYALRDTENRIYERTPHDMHRRMAKEFARIEKGKFKEPLSEDFIYSLFKDFKYIVPQGSPMFGIGNNFQIISISNCYVLDPPEDCYNSILDVDKQLVNISKRRGGVGIDLSRLRPEGTITNNASRTSTGIVSWMRRYSNSIREVGQAGRRGALMLTLSVHHPDILKFATIKNDDTEVTGANISIRLSKEFLDALENGEDYELRWPVDDKSSPSISKMVPAKEVWNTIIHSAWLRAEPGLMMWDNVMKGPADCYEEYRSVSSNPCQPGWAKVLTKNGIRELSSVNIGDEIWSHQGWTTITNKWSTGRKDVYKYSTTSGTFYGTKNHKIVEDANGTKVEVSDADSINIITGKLLDSNLIYHPQLTDIMDGLVIGDGSVHKASNDLVILYIGDDDKDYFNDAVRDNIKDHRPGIDSKAYEIVTTVKADELPKTYERRVPKRFLYGSTCKMLGFLRGLYSANGSICDKRVTLKSASLGLIEDVQMMLSALGIRSYYTINKPSEIEWDNGTYVSKQSYDLNITSDRFSFAKNIGFIQSDKTKRLSKITTEEDFKKTKPNSKTVYDIISSEFVSIEEVFDITVSNSSHTYWTQGCNVSNCSEITLSALDSCRLLCLNLLSYVERPFTKDAYFNSNKFVYHAYLAQRLMDDMIDLETEKIEAILDKIEKDPEPDSTKLQEKSMWERILYYNNNGRRTGTGVTAVGDTLAALGIKYDSEDGIEMVEEIYKELKFGCYASSIDMARQLGTFTGWDKEKEEECEHLLRFNNENIILNYDVDDPDVIKHFPCSGKELYRSMQKYGRRNISLLTTAPTGTVSILTQTTSGIEPLFRLDPYIRRKKINTNDIKSRVDFTDKSGDKWQEFEVYHPTVKKWIEVTGEKDLTKSPWYGCTANDINWVNRVKLQAGAQKHVCHAISSTVNLPTSATEEEISKIYVEAFKSGCKGITIYRDGCRTGVLVDKQVKKDRDEPRPRELPCDVHHTTVNGTQYLVLVGIHDGTPYEVFACRNGILDKSIKTGKIIKKKASFYKAEFENENELSPITSSMSEMEEIISRLTSGLLRSGADMHFIVKQLEKVGDTKEIHSFARGVSRVLKKYIPDGTEEGEKCPECSGKLIRQEGCKTCYCGWSKCS